MRTYSNKIRSEHSSYSRRQERERRIDTEWDLRFDVVHGLTAEMIIDHIKENQDSFTYVLVSGIELPDTRRMTGVNTMASKTLHIHVGVITKKPVTRAQVFDLTRPIGSYTPSGSTYAKPRDRKQPYAGWVYHHSKMIFKGIVQKDDNEPELRYEWGTLPMDGFDTAKISMIHYRRKSFGTETTKSRFQHYQDAYKEARKLGQINKDGAPVIL